jgi:hypothetical protein
MSTMTLTVIRTRTTAAPPVQLPPAAPGAAQLLPATDAHPSMAGKTVLVTGSTDGGMWLHRRPGAGLRAG